MSAGRGVWIGVALAISVLIIILSINIWFSEEEIETDVFEEKPVDVPFEVSNADVIFENGAGSFVSLKPRQKVSRIVEIKIVLDDPDIIDTIGSFKVEPDTQRAIFIPIHSKGVAGHCVMSFKVADKDKKLTEMKNLYKIRIKVKVVHEIMFGYLSILLGWAYFCAWSISYFPQLYQNMRRRSVVGLSFDYIGLNYTGHICYLIFNAAMYYNSAIQKQYTKLHPKGELPVKANDNFFSCWAVTMTTIMIGQCVLYERAEQKISIPIVTLIGGLWLSIGCCLFAAISEKITWLQFLYYLVYVKLGVTPLKYTPQVYLNYTRKSTEGWSIAGTFLDMMGGTLSLLQMSIDAINNDDWDGTLGNPGKVGLGTISITYNIIMITQHFCLYSTRPMVRRRKNTEDNTSAAEHFHHKLSQLKASITPVHKVAAASKPFIL